MKSKSWCQTTPLLSPLLGSIAEQQGSISTQEAATPPPRGKSCCSNIVSSATALERSHKTLPLQTPSVLRLPEEAALAELAHTSITQLKFTPFPPSQTAAVHPECSPSLSLLTDPEAAHPLTSAPLPGTRNKMKSCFQGNMHLFLKHSQ